MEIEHVQATEQSKEAPAAVEEAPLVAEETAAVVEQPKPVIDKERIREQRMLREARERLEKAEKQNAEYNSFLSKITSKDADPTEIVRELSNRGLDLSDLAMRYAQTGNKPETEDQKQARKLREELETVKKRQDEYAKVLQDRHTQEEQARLHTEMDRFLGENKERYALIHGLGGTLRFMEFVGRLNQEGKLGEYTTWEEVADAQEKQYESAIERELAANITSEKFLKIAEKVGLVLKPQNGSTNSLLKKPTTATKTPKTLSNKDSSATVEIPDFDSMNQEQVDEWMRAHKLL